MRKPPPPAKSRVYNEFLMESTRWDNFEHRENDIIISTPAKCGTTWTQMICALLIFQKTDFEKPLTEYSPWMDVLLAPVDKVHKQLNEQNHRRFIKTHTPLDGLPYLEQTKYICVGRDPRDVFLSLKNHLENMKPDALEICQQNATAKWQPPKRSPSDLSEWFRAWISSSCSTSPDHAGHADVLNFMKTFWEYKYLPNILMLHYSDLKADLEGEMKRIARFLNIDVDNHLWPKLVAAAEFENMKSKADRLAPQVTNDVWKDVGRFFNKGTSGQWHDVLDEQDLALYQQVMADRLEPDLANWLENGRLASRVTWLSP